MGACSNLWQHVHDLWGHLWYNRYFLREIVYKCYTLSIYHFFLFQDNVQYRLLCKPVMTLIDIFTYVFSWAGRRIGCVLVPAKVLTISVLIWMGWVWCLQNLFIRTTSFELSSLWQRGFYEIINTDPRANLTRAGTWVSETENWRLLS